LQIDDNQELALSENIFFEAVQLVGKFRTSRDPVIGLTTAIA